MNYGLSDFREIRALSSIYKGKGFEYRHQKKQTLPSIELLINEAQNIQSYVFDKIVNS